MKRLPNRPNVTMFASANRMLCRVLNRPGESVACVVFLSGRTNEEGGSERGIHYQRGAEFNKTVETTACRRLSHGERNIRPRNRRRSCRGKVFCAHKVGFDVSILICVRRAVFCRMRLPSFCCIASACLHRAFERSWFVRVEKWKRCAKINNK